MGGIVSESAFQSVWTYLKLKRGDPHQPNTAMATPTSNTSLLDDADWERFVKHSRSRETARSVTSYHNAGRVWVGKVDDYDPKDGMVYVRSRDEISIARSSVKSCKGHSPYEKARFAQKAVDTHRTKEKQKEQKRKEQKNQFQSKSGGWMPKFFGNEHAERTEVDEPEVKEAKKEFELPKHGMAAAIGAAELTGNVPELLGMFFQALDARGEKIDAKIDEKIHTVKAEVKDLLLEAHQRGAQLASGMAEKMKETNRVVVNQTGDKMFEVLNQIQNIMGKFFQGLNDSTMIYVASLILMVCVLSNLNQFAPKMAMAGVLCASFIGYKLGLFEKCADIANSFMSWIRTPSVNRPQGAHDHLVKFVVTACSFATVGVAPPALRMREALNAFSHWTGATRGLADCVAWCVSALTEVYNRIWAWTHNVEYEAAKTGIRDLDAWVKKCEAVIVAHNREVKITPERSKHITDLLAEGREFKARRWPFEDNHHVQAAVNAYFPTLDKLGMLYHAAVGLASGIRQVPLGVYLLGQPGSGKSNMTMSFVMEMLTHIYRNDPEVLKLLKERDMLFCYTRPNYTEFWEGVRRDVMAVLMNDFGQRKDIGRTEYLECLNGIDSWPFHVPMAALESKTDMFIAPKLWICTANGPMDPDALTWTKALDRRFPLKYMVVPKIEFSEQMETNPVKRKMEKKRVMAAKNVTSEDGLGWYPDVIEFVPVDFKGKQVGKPISWEAFLAKAKSTYDELERDHKAFVATTKRRMEAGIDAELAKFPKENEFQSSKGKGRATDDEIMAQELQDYERLNVRRVELGLAPIDLQAYMADDPVQRRQWTVEVVDAQLMAAVSNVQKREAEDAIIQLAEWDAHNSHRMKIGLKPVAFERWMYLAERRTILAEAYGATLKAAANPLKDVQEPGIDPQKPCTGEDNFVPAQEKVEEPEKMDPYELRKMKLPPIPGLEEPEKSKTFLDMDQNEFLDFLTKKDEKKDTEMDECVFWCMETFGWTENFARGVGDVLFPTWKIAKKQGLLEQYAKKMANIPLDVFVSRIRVVHETSIGEAIHKWTQTVVDGISPPWAALGRAALIYAIAGFGLIGIVHMVVMLGVKIAKWLASFFMTKEEVADEEEFQSDPKQPNLRRKQVRVARRHRGKFQGGDDNANSIAKKAIRKGQWLLLAGEGGIICIVSCVQGKLFTFPLHVIRQLMHSYEKEGWTPDDTVILQKVDDPSVRKEMRFGDILGHHVVSRHGSDDIAMVHWTNNMVCPGPDLLRFFLSAEEHAKLVRRDAYATLWIPDIEGNLREVDTTVLPVEGVSVFPEEGGEFVVRRAYQYKIPTRDGNCGAWLVLDHTGSGCRKILGPHAIGNQSRGLGYTSVLLREDLEDALKYFPPQIREDPSVYGNTHQGAKFAGEFATVRNVTHVQIPRVASVTQIRRSALQESDLLPWEPKKAPARLRPFVKDGVIIDPYLEAVRGYGMKHIPLRNFRWARLCAHASYVQIMGASRGMPKREMRVLTFEEAVCGDPTDEHLKSIPRKTSAGWPKCLLANAKYPGKTLWFGKDGPYELDSEACRALKREVERYIECAEKGERPLQVYLDVLKDEVLSLKKVEDGATRFISATPLVLLIVMRMYFGAMSAYFMDTRIRNGHAVGVNPYGPEWQLIVNDAFAKSRTNHLDGDAKWLDKSINPEPAWAIFEEVVAPMYGKPRDHPESMVRMVAWADIVNSRHIVGDLIYEWVYSNPSGVFLTWFLNGEMMKIGFRNGFILAFEDDETVLPEFDDHVDVKVQGDDNKVSVTSQVRDVYTPFAIRDGFAMIGITYTSADKDKPLENVYKELEKCTFLKRGFRYEPVLDRYVSPLSLDTIREMVLWHPKWDVNEEVTRDIVEIAMLELSQHDQITFDSIYEPFSKCYLDTFGEALPMRDRVQMLKKITSSTWDGIPSVVAKYAAHKQDLIGLLGAGASKGDGPSRDVPFYGMRAERMGACWRRYMYDEIATPGSMAHMMAMSYHRDALAAHPIHHRSQIVRIREFVDMGLSRREAYLYDVGMLGAGNSKGDGPPALTHTWELQVTHNRNIQRVRGVGVERRVITGSPLGKGGLCLRFTIALFFCALCGILHVPIQAYYSEHGPGSPGRYQSRGVDRWLLWAADSERTLNDALKNPNSNEVNASVHIGEEKTIQGTNEMITDRPGEVAEPEKLLTAPPNLLAMNSTSIDPDLKLALGNWVVLGSGTVDSSDTIGTELENFDPFVQWLQDPYIIAKLTGYQGIRGTFRVKVLVNGNAFQQGRLLLVWLPMVDTNSVGLMYQARMGHLTTATQLPRAELDVATEAEVVLDMPFIFPALFHSFLTGNPAWGRFGLIVYGLYGGAAGGSTSYPYVVYGAMDPDTVQLFNPTDMNTPQGGKCRPMLGANEFQSGKGGPKMGSVSKGKAPADAEQAKAGKISGAAGAVSKIAAAVAIAQPELSVFAKPLSWVAGIAEMVAKYYGHGDPLVTFAKEKVIQTEIFPAAQNCDVAKFGGSLGGLSDCSVDQMPGFAGTNVDEMQLDYLLQKSAYMATFSWATSDAVGTLLYGNAATPQACKLSVTGPPNYFVAPPVGYLAQFFGSYHGGLKYTLKFVKTAIHTGKFMAAFFPGKTSDPGMAASLPVHRMFIDLAVTKEISFVLPFTNYNAYIPTSTTSGFFGLYVVNPLIAMPTIAQSITCIVEISAAPGFEFAHLQPTPYHPVFPAIALSKGKKVKEDQVDRKTLRVINGNKFQSAGLKPMMPQLDSIPIAGAKNQDQGIELARLVVGERILSVKQLMSMMSPTYWSASSIPTGKYFRPFVLGAAEDDAGAWALTPGSLDYVSTFAPMFLLSRGGMHFGAQTVMASGNNATFAFRIDYNLSDVIPYGTQSDVDHLYRWYYGGNGGGISYVPSYSQNWARLNLMSIPDETEGLTPYTSSAKVILNMVQTGGVAQMLRGVADDYQAGFFIGVPPFASLDVNMDTMSAKVLCHQEKRKDAIEQSPPMPGMLSDSVSPIGPKQPLIKNSGAQPAGDPSLGMIVKKIGSQKNAIVSTEKNRGDTN